MNSTIATTHSRRRLPDEVVKRRRLRAGVVRIAIEHDVHISLGGPDYFRTLCVNATAPREAGRRPSGTSR